MITTLLAFGLLTIIRIFHRLYFLQKGHKHARFSPPDEMNEFLSSTGSKIQNCSIKSSVDGTTIRYKKIGNGTKVVYLANGVGTNFWMWLPTLRFMHTIYPELFQTITLLAPMYRGLFNEKSHKCEDVNVTMPNCVEDAHDILIHEKIKSFYAIIGWSTGAQMALFLCTKYSNITERIFLLNPSSGKTLHTIFQPFIPLPSFLGKWISTLTHTLIKTVRPWCDIPILYNIIRYISRSEPMFWILSIAAFFTGAPPEQPVYFNSYVHDLFETKEHTKHLLGI